MQTRAVFNLEFPHYITEFRIGNYHFRQAAEYRERYVNLQHVIGLGEDITVKTGSHQQTATIEYPDTEPSSILPWGNPNPTQLQDVLLLLTVFGDRNLLALREEDKNGAIMENHGVHGFGGELMLSLGHEEGARDRDTGRILTTEEAAGLRPVFDYDVINLAFEKNLNKVFDLILTSAWQEKYARGAFFFTYRQVIQPQVPMETAFILCWSIWEHLFALHHKKWMSPKTIQTLESYEKIAFIVSEYFLKSFEPRAKEQVGRLVKTRNRIVHFGMKPDDVDYGEIKIFIRLTEQLIAIILGLKPSNIFNSQEWLDSLTGVA